MRRPRVYTALATVAHRVRQLAKVAQCYPRLFGLLIIAVSVLGNMAQAAITHEISPEYADAADAIMNGAQLALTVGSVAVSPYYATARLTAAALAFL